MTIRAIDLQVLIPRSTEVSKVQQVSAHQTALQQQQHAEEWRHIAANRQQQVQRTNQNAGGKVEPDAERGSSGRHEAGGDEKRHPDSRSEPAEAAADPALGHTIDIKT